jgi:putative transposase
MMESKTQNRKRVHLTDFGSMGSSFIYFLTVCTAHKEPYFLDKRIKKIITDELEFRRIKGEIKLFFYCIMPDHLHLLLSLGERYQKNLQNWISAFKRYISRQTNVSFSVRPLWQKNFYDHIVRTDESVSKIAEYIVNNPVRQGLVSVWKEYPYSRIVDIIPV